MMIMMMMIIRLLFMKVPWLQLRGPKQKQHNKDTKMVTGKTYKKTQL